MMKDILKFLFIFIFCYILFMWLLSQWGDRMGVYSVFRSAVTGLVTVCLPSAHIESQIFRNPETNQTDPSSMYLVYGNPVLIQRAMDEAKKSGHSEIRIPTYSTTFKLFEMFGVPLFFLLSIFIATPLSIKLKMKGMAISLFLMFVFLLFRCVFLSLFSISNQQIGIYELSGSSMDLLGVMVSVFSLGFSMSLCFVLWLIFGFRRSAFITYLTQIFKSDK